MWFYINFILLIHIYENVISVNVFALLYFHSTANNRFAFKANLNLKGVNIMSSLPSAKLKQNIFNVIMRANWRIWSNPFSNQLNSENQKMVISIFVVPWSLLITQQVGPKFQLERHLRLFLYDFYCFYRRPFWHHRRAHSTTASQLLPFFYRYAKRVLK